MELVYLWVDKYKNIENEGFNFSPKFECYYDENSHNLTIEDKKHIKNLFDDDGKINITAIVGENGSGKSTLLECIKEIFIIENDKCQNTIVIPEHCFNFIMKFRFNNIIYEIKNKDALFETNIPNNENISNLIRCFTYSNFNSEFDMFSLSDYIIANKLVSDNQSNNINFKISSFMFLPLKVEVSKCNFYEKFENLVSDEKLYPLSKYQSDSEYLDNKKEEIQSMLLAFKGITDSFHQFLIIEKFKRTNDFNQYNTKEELKEELNLDISEDDFIDFLNEEDWSSQNEKLLVDLNNIEKIFYNEYFDYFNFDFIDEKGRKFSSLSHGEQMIFGQLLNIYFYMKDNNNMIFLLDEPEISLHSQWQKNYINEVYNLCKLFERKDIQIVITSHSPFILSDLPKENVIFLKDGKQVDGIDKKQTFGANIHTLLSDGFFMDGGLMGEFAKGKI